MVDFSRSLEYPRSLSKNKTFRVVEKLILLKLGVRVLAGCMMSLEYIWKGRARSFPTERRDHDEAAH